MQKYVYLIIALLWSTQAGAGIEIRFASSSVRTLGQMQCSPAIQLEDVSAGDFVQLILNNCTGAPTGDETPGCKGSTTIMVFDDNGALFARDTGGSATNVAANLVLFRVETAEEEQIRLKVEDGPILFLDISPENFSTGLLVFTWSGTGFAELQNFGGDLGQFPPLTTFWECEGKGMGEISIPIRVE